MEPNVLPFLQHTFPIIDANFKREIQRQCKWMVFVNEVVWVYLPGTCEKPIGIVFLAMLWSNRDRSFCLHPSSLFVGCCFVLFYLPTTHNLCKILVYRADPLFSLSSAIVLLRFFPLWNSLFPSRPYIRHHPTHEDMRSLK